MTTSLGGDTRQGAPAQRPPPVPIKNNALMLMESIASVGAGQSLLLSLTDEERERVLSHGRRRVLYRGATLFSQGRPHEGIFLIESGRIRVFYTAPSGREITRAYWSAGNFVGGPEILGEGTYSWSGTAATNSVVVLIPGKVMRKLVLEIPRLALWVIEQLSFKGRCYAALAQMLGTRSVTERLANLLLHLAEVHGLQKDGATTISGFTHAELAHLVGATRQWVTISLKRLQDNGVIAIEKSQISVLRIDALQRMREGHAC